MGGLCLAALGGSPAAQPAALQTLPSLQFRQAEIAEVVEAVGRATGRAFVFGDGLVGRVTILVPGPISADAALELLDVALRLRGFVAIPGPEGVYRILPLESLPEAAPFREGPLSANREGPVVTLLRPRWSDAAAIADALGPLIGGGSRAVVYEPDNALILAGPEVLVHRLIVLARTLDEADRRGLAVIRARYRGADELLTLLEGVFARDGGAIGKVRLVADARSNALVVEASPVELTRIRSLVRRFDTPPEVASEGLYVVRIRHTDAQSLAAVLREGGAPPAGRRARAGAAASEQAPYSLTVDAATNSLLIAADPATFADLAQAIEQLDVYPPSIEIDAQIIEVDTPATLEVAIDALIPVTIPGQPDDPILFVRSVTSSAGQILDSDQLADNVVLRFMREPFEILATDENGDTVVVGEVPGGTAVLVAENTVLHSRLLMRPHLLVLSGQEHELFSGDNVPVLVQQVQPEGQQNPLQTRTNIERHDVGLRFRVRPSVGLEGGPVRVALDLEFSTVVPSVAGDPTEVGPTFRTRHLTTTVTLKGGQVVVVGASGEPRTVRVETRTPFLASIPVLGQFFKGVREESRNNHIIIALRARTIRSRQQLLVESARHRIAFERELAGFQNLRAVSPAPYAIRLNVYGDLAEAEGAVADVAFPESRVAVVPWPDRSPRFDLYVVGFESLEEVTDAAAELSKRGWRAEIVAVPGS